MVSFVTTHRHQLQVHQPVTGACPWTLSKRLWVEEECAEAVRQEKEAYRSVGDGEMIAEGRRSRGRREASQTRMTKPWLFRQLFLRSRWRELANTLNDSCMRGYRIILRWQLLACKPLPTLPRPCMKSSCRRPRRDAFPFYLGMSPGRSRRYRQKPGKRDGASE